MSDVVSSGGCPCGSGATLDDCCGPVVRNERLATGPEELMRSRYTAYAVHDVDHLFRTWHPRTRPDDVSPDEHLTWTRLEVLEATGSVVEFRAHWSWADQSGVLHERSRFEERSGRWVYLDGDPITD